MSEYGTAESAEAGLAVGEYAGVRSWAVMSVGLELSVTPELKSELIFKFPPGGADFESLLLLD
jgi:hypothetical protein